MPHSEVLKRRSQEFYELPSDNWRKNLGGGHYLCVGVELTRSEGGVDALSRRHAFSLGCEIAYAKDFVYADGLDVTARSAFDPTGVSCRICERAEYVQRAVPPLKSKLAVDHDRRGILPYWIL